MHLKFVTIYVSVLIIFNTYKIAIKQILSTECGDCRLNRKKYSGINATDWMEVKYDKKQFKL